MRALLDRVIGLADEPTDDDDLRLRKRVTGLAGYVPVVAPSSFPCLARAWR